MAEGRGLAGLYWVNFHAPSVGFIRAAQARIQGPVTCPAGEWGAGGAEGVEGGGSTKRAREGPLGAVEGHSRGAPTFHLNPEGHGDWRRDGGWGG